MEKIRYVSLMPMLLCIVLINITCRQGEEKLGRKYVGVRVTQLFADEKLKKQVWDWHDQEKRSASPTWLETGEPVDVQRISESENAVYVESTKGKGWIASSDIVDTITEEQIVSLRRKAYSDREKGLCQNEFRDFAGIWIFEEETIGICISPTDIFQFSSGSTGTSFGLIGGRSKFKVIPEGVGLEPFTIERTTEGMVFNGEKLFKKLEPIQELPKEFQGIYLNTAQRVSFSSEYRQKFHLCDKNAYIGYRDFGRDWNAPVTEIYMRFHPAFGESAASIYLKAPDFPGGWAKLRFYSTEGNHNLKKMPCTSK